VKYSLSLTSKYKIQNIFEIKKLIYPHHFR
jgi:hypothetical protein